MERLCKVFPLGFSVYPLSNVSGRREKWRKEFSLEKASPVSKRKLMDLSVTSSITLGSVPSIMMLLVGAGWRIRSHQLQAIMWVGSDMGNLCPWDIPSSTDQTFGRGSTVFDQAPYQDTPFSSDCLHVWQLPC